MTELAEAVLFKQPTVTRVIDRMERDGWVKRQRTINLETTRMREGDEVLALVGDIAVQEDGGKKVHAHVVLGRRDGSACGGHLLAAKVRPTLEVILTESPNYLRRVHDRETGLALIRIGA